MAFSLNDDRDRDFEDQPRTPAPSMGGGAGGGTSVTDPSAGAPQGGAPGRFVTLDQYYNLNKPTADNMANGVGNAVEEQNRQVGQQIDTFRTNGAQTIKQGGTPDYGALDALQPAYQQAQSAANSLGSIEGLQNFTNQNFHKDANYTEGASRLDAGLIHRGGGQRFSDLRSRYGAGDAIGAARAYLGGIAPPTPEPVAAEPTPPPQSYEPVEEPERNPAHPGLRDRVITNPGKGPRNPGIKDPQLGSHGRLNGGKSPGYDFWRDMMGYDD